jgi:hypothetical protein
MISIVRRAFTQTLCTSLSGDWLARAGFTAGCIFAVAAEHGRLMVTVEARPKPLPGRRG